MNEKRKRPRISRPEKDTDKREDNNKPSERKPREERRGSSYDKKDDSRDRPYSREGNRKDQKRSTGSRGYSKDKPEWRKGRPTRKPEGESTEERTAGRDAGKRRYKEDFKSDRPRKTFPGKYDESRPSPSRGYKDRQDERRSDSSERRPARDRNEVRPSDRDHDRKKYKDDFKSDRPRKTFPGKYDESRPSSNRGYKDRQDERRSDSSERRPPRDRNEVRPSDRDHGRKKYKDDYKSDRPRKAFPGLKSKRSKSDTEEIRLNKYIANAGICSRREADKLIEAGVIKVNGEVVTELGTKIKPEDRIQYGDQTLNAERSVYLLLNKPKGYITTTDDPHERKTVMLLVNRACNERIYPVGRLDRNTTGLLLFTNDGELAKKLIHPKHNVKKIYHVVLDKPLAKNDMLTIADGLELEDGKAEVDKIAWVDSANDKKEVGLELHSGKNRIVRRIFEHLDYKVTKLDRVMFAGLTKKDLPRGKYRFLTPSEVNLLKRLS